MKTELPVASVRMHSAAKFVLLCLLLLSQCMRTVGFKLFPSSPSQRFAQLQMSTAPEQMSNKVFVGNLSFKITEAEVKKLAADLQCEGIHTITVPRGKKTKRGLGFAFIDFGSVEQAIDAAGKIDGSEFQGRTVNSNVKDPNNNAEKPAKKTRVEVCVGSIG